MKRNEWPSLAELLNANKRVIVFIDEGADGSAGSIVDFILPQFQMVGFFVIPFHLHYSLRVF